MVEAVVVGGGVTKRWRIVWQQGNLRAQHNVPSPSGPVRQGRNAASRVWWPATLPRAFCSGQAHLPRLLQAAHERCVVNHVQLQACWHGDRATTTVP